VPESDVATVVKGVATLTSKNWHSCTKSHLNSHYQSLSVTFNHSIGRSIDRSKTETGVKGSYATVIEFQKNNFFHSGTVKHLAGKPSLMLFLPASICSFGLFIRH
jgi:hypothetical protein